MLLGLTVVLSEAVTLEILLGVDHTVDNFAPFTSVCLNSSALAQFLFESLESTEVALC